MTAYALGITPLIHHLLDITSSNKLYSKEIAYTDDFTVAGSVKDIKCYWEHMVIIQKHRNPISIVKSQDLETANVVFRNTKINSTSEGTRHLGAVIGNHPYKEKCK